MKSQHSCCFWNDGTQGDDIPVGYASWLNLLDEDAQLSTVLAFQAHHTKAETSRWRLLQLHVGHVAPLDHIRILLTVASKLEAAFRSLFEVPQEERTQLVVSESHLSLCLDIWFGLGRQNQGDLHVYTYGADVWRHQNVTYNVCHHNSIGFSSSKQTVEYIFT